jgi:hypothetical protein
VTVFRGTTATQADLAEWQLSGLRFDAMASASMVTSVKPPAENVPYYELHCNP